MPPPPRSSRRVANEKEQTSSYPTPSLDDIIMSEQRSAKLPKNTQAVYGETTPTHGDWPNHKLAYISPVNQQNQQKWVYVADREDQDNYNWELDGNQVVRTYVIRRDLFFARPEGHVDAIADEFLHPPVATADIKFSDYGFADDTTRRIGDKELDSLYIVIKRRFLEPVTTEIRYNDQFKKNVRITKEIVAHTEPVTSPTPVATGGQVEVQHGNQYHNVKITQLLVNADGTTTTYPYSLEDIPSTRNFAFPSRLESVNLIIAWAVAFNPNHRSSYSEDYYFDFKITDPRPGPYAATIERWITDDPTAIQTANPRTAIPQPVREAIGIVNWWFYQDDDSGTATSASAKEWSVPASIHEAVTVNLGGLTSTAPSTRYRTETLAATTGVSAFLALSEATVHYQAREMGLGLFEVSIIKIDITNLYS